MAQINHHLLTFSHRSCLYGDSLGEKPLWVDQRCSTVRLTNT
jgi:hypothetical protein